jgi:hypothetical protein
MYEFSYASTRRCPSTRACCLTCATTIVHDHAAARPRLATASWPRETRAHRRVSSHPSQRPSFTMLYTSTLTYIILTLPSTTHSPNGSPRLERGARTAHPQKFLPSSRAQTTRLPRPLSCFKMTFRHIHPTHQHYIHHIHLTHCVTLQNTSQFTHTKATTCAHQPFGRKPTPAYFGHLAEPLLTAAHRAVPSSTPNRRSKPHHSSHVDFRFRRARCRNGR